MSIIAKSAIGLDISDASIEALEIEKKFNKLTITAYSRIELAPGIVENGRIQNKDKLVESLSLLWSKSRPREFSTKKIVLSIPESRTFIHVFRMPGVISAENIGESVQFEADATIPISFDQAYHDYQVINRIKDFQEVLYIACMKDVIDDYKEVLARAELEPLVFEAESMSLVRALAHDETSRSALLVDIGARNTIITAYDHQGVRYSHNIRIGGEAFKEIIIKAQQASDSEAERLMKTIGLIKERVKGTVAFNLEPVILDIATAVKKVLDYNKKRLGLNIEKVILCGGASLVPGLDEYLQNNLNIEIENGQPLSGLEYDRSDCGFSAGRSAILYATVIGLAKRGLDNEAINLGINLLPRDEEKIMQRQTNINVKELLGKFFSIFAKKQNSKKAHKKIEENKPEKKFKSVNKRQIILISIFVFLTLLFIGILIASQGKEEPLIQFQEYNNPDGPVVN